jgi:uncharacterized membrane protein YcfT
MKQALLSVSLFALALPMVTFAQFGGIDTFIQDISTFINNILIPLVFALALFFFIYGVFNYTIRGKEDPTDKEKGREYMIWAVVGFVVMVSIFGIVNLIAGGLGFSDEEEIDNIPNVPTTNR